MRLVLFDVDGTLVDREGAAGAGSSSGWWPWADAVADAGNIAVGVRDGARGACSSCEAVRCLHEELVGDVGSAVAFVFDDVQGRSRQLPCETPDHTER